MDCILFRSEAFRHLLFNREPICRLLLSVEEDGGGGGSRWKFNGRGLIQFSSGAYLIRCVWNVIVFKDIDGYGHGEDEDVFQMLLQTFLGDFILITSTILTGILIVKANHYSSSSRGATKNKSDTTTSNMDQSYFLSKMYLALVIPYFFHGITLAVSIWERSSTIYMLGTLFVMSLQHKGVAVVMEERFCCNRNSSGDASTDHVGEVGQRQETSSGLLYLPQSFPFIVGVLILCIAAQALGFGVFTQPWTDLSLPRGIFK